uniref:hypothetical protein n=1 Tax=Tahibacter caeni TaxID=1453545 RepID=UPI00214961B1
ANQLLQIGVGLACAFGTAGIVAWCGWRERALAAPVRATAVLAAVVAVFWLANARMLMHSHEIVHAQLLTLSVSVAVLGVWQAHVAGSWRWLAVATLACCVATFSFGSGLASFVAVILLGLLLRLPRAWLLLPGAGMALCLFLYLVVLPGDDSVREVIAFRPLDSLITSARWLASPWINGWLGLADPPLYPWIADSVGHTWLGAVLKDSASLVDALPGANWRTTTSALLGFTGMAALAAAFLGRLQRREMPTRLEAVALGLGLFAASCAGIVGLSRLDYLHDNPNQVFADRYLVWPCLFWLSLALLALARAARRGRRSWIAAALGLVVAAPLLVTHRYYSAWSAAVYQGAQRFAAAARSDVVDPAMLPNSADADPQTVMKTLALLRERRLAMFAPTWLPVGAVWDGTVADDGLSVSLLASEPVIDAVSGRTALHFTGTVDEGIRRVAGGPLAVLDAQRRVRGYAQFSFIRPGAKAFRLTLPAKRGFDGYIADYDPAETYELVHWDERARGHARRLLRLHDAAIVAASTPR